MILCVAVTAATSSCGDTKPPTAPAIHLRDSSSILTSYGVSKLISDSGRIRYKVVAEEWRIYDRTNPPRHSFPKGILLEKFSPNYHIEMFITADTAYWYDQNLWELRGCVKMWDRDGTLFTSQRLYWDMRRHEFYSNVYSHLKTPDKEVEGMSFRSDTGRISIARGGSQRTGFGEAGGAERRTAADIGHCTPNACEGI